MRKAFIALIQIWQHYGATMEIFIPSCDFILLIQTSGPSASRLNISSNFVGGYASLFWTQKMDQFNYTGEMLYTSGGGLFRNNSNWSINLIRTHSFTTSFQLYLSIISCSVEKQVTLKFYIKRVDKDQISLWASANALLSLEAEPFKKDAYPFTVNIIFFFVPQNAKDCR